MRGTASIHQSGPVDGGLDIELDTLEYHKYASFSWSQATALERRQQRDECG